MPRDGGAGRGFLIWTMPWSKTLGQMLPSTAVSRAHGHRAAGAITAPDGQTVLRERKDPGHKWQAGTGPGSA